MSIFIKSARWILSGIKSVWPYLSSPLVKMAFGLTGVYGYLASFVIKKVGEEAILEGEVALDKEANSEAIKVIQSLDGKKLTPEESQKLDEAEKEILEGK